MVKAALWTPPSKMVKAPDLSETLPPPYGHEQVAHTTNDKATTQPNPHPPAPRPNPSSHHPGAANNNHYNCNADTARVPRTTRRVQQERDGEGEPQ